MSDNSLKYTVIFGGGAIRGIAYIGAVNALKEYGVEINVPPITQYFTPNTHLLPLFYT